MMVCKFNNNYYLKELAFMCVKFSMKVRNTYFNMKLKKIYITKLKFEALMVLHI